MRPADRFQNQEIPDRFGYSQSERFGCCMLVLCGELRPAFKCRDEWTTTRCLDANHSGSFGVDPSQLLHFIESLPHAYQSRSSAGWIQDHMRELPIELLREFVSKRLLALQAKRLFKGGKIEPTFGCAAPGGFTTTFGDKSFHKINLCSHHLALD